MNENNKYNEADDIKMSKKIACVSYLLFFLPLVKYPYNKSRFARYHANQSLLMLLSVVILILFFQLVSFFLSFLNLIDLISWFIKVCAFLISYFFSFVFVVYGIRNSIAAYKGFYKKLPFIGNIMLIKRIRDDL